MSTETMFRCINAYSANFSNVEQAKEFIRFSDEKILDMYDHNFILVKPDLDFTSIESIINTEIENRKRQGYDFCHVHLMLRSDEELASLQLPINPEISQYI